MMNHLLIIFLFITLIVSSANIFLIYVLKNKTNSKLLKYYLFFILVLFFDNFISLITDYLLLNIDKNDYSHVILYIEDLADIISLILYLFYVSKISKLILQANLFKDFYIIYRLGIFISAVTLIVVTIYYSLPLMLSFKLMLYLIIVLSIFLMLIKLKSVKQQVINKHVRNIFKFAVILFPLIIFENIKHLFNLPMTNLNGLFGPTFFIALNSYSLFIASQFLFNLEEKRVALKLENLFTKYNLTNKERELTKMVFDGYSNKQISDKLFISEGTVKNYLYRIYKKLDINSRLKLINLIKDS